MKLHHVQVACAPRMEDSTRRFYADGLGLTEVEKPDDLKPKGGVWFRAHDAEGVVTVEIHVGVEDPFAPALKAHPALQFESVSELEDVATRLVSLGFAVDWSSGTTFRATSVATLQTVQGTESSYWHRPRRLDPFRKPNVSRCGVPARPSAGSS